MTLNKLNCLLLGTLIVISLFIIFLVLAPYTKLTKDLLSISSTSISENQTSLKIDLHQTGKEDFKFEAYIDGKVTGWRVY